MKQIWLVFKNEFITVVSRPSFFLMLILLPAIGFGVMYFMQGAEDNDAAEVIGEVFSSPETITMEGLVDESGIIESIPQDFEPYLQTYSNSETALKAIEDGDIGAFYVIPGDYLDNGEIEYFQGDYSLVSGMDQGNIVDSLIQYNLLGQDQELLAHFQQPYNLTRQFTEVDSDRDPGSALTFLLPYAVTMLFYIVILTSSSLLLNSVTKEKQNRVMEILMTSVNPMQMLSGKILGLGAAGLLQMIVWSGTGFLLLRLSGQSFDIPDTFQLEPGFLAWGVLFFILGYVIYASLMAGVGALVPNIKEASQATMIVVLPMIIPMMFISVLIETPNGLFSTIMSLFPLTSPVVMMTRMSAVTVPWWQIGLSILLLVLTGYIILRAVAGMFRAQNLLSGQSFKISLFFKALLGRI